MNTIKNEFLDVMGTTFYSLKKIKLVEPSYELDSSNMLRVCQTSYSEYIIYIYMKRNK